MPIQGERAERFLVAKGKNWRVVDRENNELLSHKVFPSKGKSGFATVHGNWFVRLEDYSYWFIDGTSLEVSRIAPQLGES